jgi:hypothetical protein
MSWSVKLLVRIREFLEVALSYDGIDPKFDFKYTKS